MFSPTLSLLSKIHAAASVDQSGLVTFTQLDEHFREFWPRCSQQAVLMTQLETIVSAGRNLVASWSTGDLAKAVRELDIALQAIEPKVPEPTAPTPDTFPQFEHAEHAANEGWCISLADGSEMNRAGDRPFQLQTLDEAQIFETDAQAIGHVVDRAAGGSLIHISALNFLRENSPAEYAEIESGAYRTWDPTKPQDAMPA